MKAIEPRFYLNKLLKPDLNGRYKVYLRFNIGKNNHRFKSQLINVSLGDEIELENYKDLIQLETTYLNTPITYYNGEFPFNFYSDDIHRLHYDLYSLFTSEENTILTKIDIEDTYVKGTYQEYNDEILSGIPLYDKPSLIENSSYRNMLITFLHNKTNLEIDYIDYIIDNDVFSSALPLETSFVTSESTLEYIQACNALLLFSKREEINVYNWVFKGFGKLFCEKFGQVSYDLINDYIISICHDIFAVKNIYERIEMLKS